MIDTKNGEARLLDFLEGEKLPSVTLEELTGNHALAQPEADSSGLELRVGEAWRTPLNDIKCGQVRVLVGQRLGLEWLARPVALFVAAYPQAECDIYPGDLTINALLSWKDFANYAGPETDYMLATDFRWLDAEVSEGSAEAIVRRAHEALARAREARGIAVSNLR